MDEIAAALVELANAAAPTAARAPVGAGASTVAGAATVLGASAGATTVAGASAQMDGTAGPDASAVAGASTAAGASAQADETAAPDASAVAGPVRHLAESSAEALDSVAAALVELTTSSAPFSGFRFGGGAAAQDGSGPGSEAEAAPGDVPTGPPPIFLDVADEPKCVDCGTCYQELPQLFEKATIIVDGAAKTVGHLIPGALGKLVITPDLKRKFNKVKANCDAEIIK
jgi:hypothetical protein